MTIEYITSHHVIRKNKPRVHKYTEVVRDTLYYILKQLQYTSTTYNGTCTHAYQVQLCVYIKY